MCADAPHMQRVLAALLGAGECSIRRVKDRVNHPTSMGWIDVMVNLTLTSDKTDHVCEVQIMHGAMLNARKTLGGHGPYSRVRAAVTTSVWKITAARTGLSK